ncbi:MAG: hypothetical protein QOK29_2653 [Rhodospirillaceae bacterium]|nr:hypothetical protein [Rhodospirillaceae bacterium]
MSGYQYYAFQAIDRPLGEADRQALRALSTRAQITATSFTNSYEWGDFKGNPVELMRRWFDFHLYLANWGTRQLIFRLPKRLVGRDRLDGFLRDVDCAELEVSGENLIVHILREETVPDDGWEDGSGWFADLMPLRAEVLAGDLRLFYLVWLMAVEADAVEPGATEPLPGIGPMTEALEAFADFFQIDPDLVAAAAERSADPLAGKPLSSVAARRIVAELTDGEKTELLMRLFEDDPHVGNELRARVRNRLISETAAPPVAPRTVGELRASAEAIRLARERTAAEEAAAERKRQEEEAERSRRARLDVLMRRGQNVWREIEADIESRQPKGYDSAAGLIFDLNAIAEEQGTIEDFNRRLQAIRERHANKRRFIERLTGLR